MKVIAKHRGEGKTYELMHLAAENDGQLLVVNKRAIRTKANYYGLENLPIIDWNDILYGKYDEEKPLYIDDAEYVFSILLENDFKLKLEGLSVDLGDNE